MFNCLPLKSSKELARLKLFLITALWCKLNDTPLLQIDFIRISDEELIELLYRSILFFHHLTCPVKKKAIELWNSNVDLGKKVEVKMDWPIKITLKPYSVVAEYSSRDQFISRLIRVN